MYKFISEFTDLIIIFRGRLLDRYRIGTNTGCIVSNHIIISATAVSADITCITAGSAAAVNKSITQQIKGHSCPHAAHDPRYRRWLEGQEEGD